MNIVYSSHAPNLPSLNLTLQAREIQADGSGSNTLAIDGDMAPLANRPGFYSIDAGTVTPGSYSFHIFDDTDTWYDSGVLVIVSATRYDWLNNDGQIDDLQQNAEAVDDELQDDFGVLPTRSPSME